METDYGQQLFGNDRCQNCVDAKRECWVFREEVVKDVLKNAGGACTHCRFDRNNKGCSAYKKGTPRKRDFGKGKKDTLSPPINVGPYPGQQVLLMF